MPIIIKPEDVARVIGTAAPETSNARKYFTRAINRNSTQIAISDIKKTVGNIPVIARGGNGVRPVHMSDVTAIIPMPIEIDDTITAVQMDEYERATGLGRQQIIDTLLGYWFEVVRRTTRALCAQAHKGSIDYMMQAGTEMVRYQVDYGTVIGLTDATAVANLKASQIITAMEALIDKINGNGIGGDVEFVAESSVYSQIIEVAAAQKSLPVTMGSGFIDFGGYRVMRDNDVWEDIAANGTKTTNRMLATGELLARAVNAGQELDFLRVDDTIAREAMPMYSFTKERNDQRGTELYVKSKPFPLVNVKGLAVMKFGA